MRAARTALFVGFLIIARWSFAEPGLTPTLWELIGEADVIVVARVDATKPLPLDEEQRGPSHVALLTIRETIKGNASGLVEVAYAGNQGCPAPERYREGELVLAFLVRDGAAWRTVGGSYGTRFPGSAEDLEQTRQLIRLTTQMRGISPGAEPPISWSLVAIAAPATREEGLWSLEHDAVLRRLRGNPSVDEPSPITLAAIEAAFVEHPSLGSSFPAMLELLATRSSSAVTQVAVDGLESVLRPGTPPGWAGAAMNLLEVRLDRSALSRQQAAEAKVMSTRRQARQQSDEEQAAELRTRWEGNKRRLKLKPANTSRP